MRTSARCRTGRHDERVRAAGRTARGSVEFAQCGEGARQRARFGAVDEHCAEHARQGCLDDARGRDEPLDGTVDHRSLDRLADDRAPLAEQLSRQLRQRLVLPRSGEELSHERGTAVSAVGAEFGLHRVEDLAEPVGRGEGLAVSLKRLVDGLAVGGRDEVAQFAEVVEDQRLVDACLGRHGSRRDGRESAPSDDRDDGRTETALGECGCFPRHGTPPPKPLRSRSMSPTSAIEQPLKFAEKGGTPCHSRSPRVRRVRRPPHPASRGTTLDSWRS